MHTAHQKNRLLEFWMQIENNFIDIQNKNSLQKLFAAAGWWIICPQVGRVKEQAYDGLGCLGVLKMTPCFGGKSDF